MMAPSSIAHPANSETVLIAALFDKLAEPILLCDGSLCIVAANNAARELLGIPAEDLVGRQADEVLPVRGAERHATPPGPRTSVEWRCEYLRAEGPCELEVSGTSLSHDCTRAEGWALRLRGLREGQSAPDFIGRSAAVQELLEFVSRIARSGANSILLLGESGTGKDLIAKRLHALSGRSAAPFLAINCAALPESLLESELFGYEKGAFTSAGQTKEGLLEVTDGGSVFLDEIGEMALPLQAKLLRVLEDHTFRRVGGSRDISVDVRIIGATNADLDKAIEERRFRSDLYYRLNGVQIRLPALRERPEDIQELAIHFLGHFNRLHNRNLRGIHPGAQRMLDLHPWPGNVRELRNRMERAVLVETAPIVMPASLALAGRDAEPKPTAANKAAGKARFSLRSGEQDLIAAALSEAGGNQTRAAELLGIGRFSLRYKMKKLGLL